MVFFRTMDLLDASSLAAKGIAPVKREHIQPPRKRTALEAVGASAHHSVEKRSRIQDKRARAATANSRICMNFAQGLCERGVNCKFSHDMALYIASRPPDLSGGCPNSCLQSCPYGILCRWATKHKNPDVLTRDWLLRGHQVQGTPTATLPLASSIVKPSNTLPNHVQHMLRRRCYDFSRASATLQSLGMSERRLKAKSRLGKQSMVTPFPSCCVNENDLPKESGLETGALEGDSPVHAAAPSLVTAASDVRGGHTNSISSYPTESCVEWAGLGEQDAAVPVYDISASSKPGSAAVGGRDRARPVNFRGKTYCAPLTTNGNLPFRRVVKGFGCDITCGEMAMAQNLLQGQSSEWALLKRHACEDVFGVQICVGHPDMAARCVQLLDDTCSMDFIDINMGCPIDLVCNKGAGASLLLKPRKMESVIRAASQVATNCSITFKTRTAFHDKQRIAHSVLPLALEWGASAVTLHGRSRQQRYTRSADWDYIEEVASAVPEELQVIGNGDVFSYEDFDRHLSTGKVATCMIARGALIKPWIFSEVKERRHWDISATERFDMLKQFCSFGLEHWGSDSRGVENVRRFLLEWLSFLYRYIPVGLLELLPQQMTWRPPTIEGRSDLETMLCSSSAADWVRISEMLLGPAPEGFQFVPRHQSNAYVATDADVDRIHAPAPSLG